MKTNNKITEQKLSATDLKTREKIIKDLLKNKSSLVKRYGKEAEKVLYGRSTNVLKKMKNNQTKQKLKELVRKSLMKEEDIEVGADRYEEEQDVTMASNLLDTLESLLQKHDWYYEMSDDHEKWRKGDSEEREIKKRMSELSSMGYGDDAKALHNQYNPYKKTNESFPDLTGDGKVTKADILKGRGVKLKEYSEEVSTLALTFKNPNEFERAKKHFESTSDFFPYEINDEFRTFHFEVQDEADADSTEYYLTQELEGDTDLQGYYFSVETSPSNLDEDLDLGHQDNEPHMLKGDLYRIGKYAMELYQMVDKFEGPMEVDFPHWWQAKIIKAKEMIVAAKHYLDFETKESQIDTMMDTVEDAGTFDNVGVDKPMFETKKSIKYTKLAEIIAKKLKTR